MFIIDQINARALEQALIRIIYDNSCLHQIGILPYTLYIVLNMKIRIKDINV